MAERAFRTMKNQIEIRPIYHHLEDRVRARAFLSMLAYDLAYELHQILAPLLFTDTEPPPPTDPVAPPTLSAAKTKAASQTTQRPPRPQPRRPDRRPRHLLRNQLRIGHAYPLTRLTKPTQLQTRAFELLGIKPHT